MTFYVDVRFIVDAKTEKEAFDLVDKYLPDIPDKAKFWYTYAKVESDIPSINSDTKRRDKL